MVKPGFRRRILNAVANILERLLEWPAGARLAALFFDLLDSSHSAAHRGTGLLRAHAAADVLLDFALDVKAKFGVHFALEPRLAGSENGWRRRACESWQISLCSPKDAPDGA